MSESSLLCVRCGAYKYEGRSWVRLDKEYCRLDIMQTPNPNKPAYRLLCLDAKTMMFVMNCVILDGMAYLRSSPVFHQLKDSNSQIFGLHFSTPKEADDFSNTLSQISSLHLILDNNAKEDHSPQTPSQVRFDITKDTQTPPRVSSPTVHKPNSPRGKNSVSTKRQRSSSVASVGTTAAGAGGSASPSKVINSSNNNKKSMSSIESIVSPEIYSFVQLAPTPPPISDSSEQILSKAQKKYEILLRNWKVPEFRKNRLPSIFPEVMEMNYPDVFVNWNLYFHFEVFLKAISLADFLYFASDVYDLENSVFTSNEKLTQLALLIAKRNSELLRRIDVSKFEAILQDIHEGSQDKRIFEKIGSSKGEIKGLLLFGFDEFRRSYTKHNSELEATVDTTAAIKKDHFGRTRKISRKRRPEYLLCAKESDFFLLYKDEVLREHFLKYLKDRNSLQWWDFLLAIDNFKKKEFVDKEAIWEAACSIAATYLFLSVSTQNRVIPSIPSLVDELKQKLDKTSCSTAIFDTIQSDILAEVRVMYREYCWHIRKNSHEMAKFTPVIQLDNDNPFVMPFFEKCAELNLSNQFHLMNTLYKLKKQKVSDDQELVGKVNEVAAKYLGTSKQPVMTDVSSFFHPSLLQRVLVMIEEGVYSAGMLDPVLEYLKQYLGTIFVDDLLTDPEKRKIKTPREKF
eukprot:TRINITY_DN10427_c0_g1_i1.p1 TRINITY_DN10427_c0_g1~~TRINITY_DN10427_c0_g1_i1.p1  ORF type:complete len:683 (-),score=186.36 TRINITY_DN10427_c0_g1_i1:58-2106(-)